MKKKASPILVIFYCIFWAATALYAYWYLSTGWDGPNAIMVYCSQFASSDIWSELALRHGAINWAAFAAMAYPAVALFAALIMTVRGQRGNKVIGKLFKLFFTLVIYGALAAVTVYSCKYLMDERPLIAGLLILFGICAVIPAGKSVWVIIIED